MAKEICADCEKVFEGGPKAFLCPECRKRRVREAHRKSPVQDADHYEVERIATDGEPSVAMTPHPAGVFRASSPGEG